MIQMAEEDLSWCNSGLLPSADAFVTSSPLRLPLCPYRYVVASCFFFEANVCNAVSRQLLCKVLEILFTDFSEAHTVSALDV